MQIERKKETMQQQKRRRCTSRRKERKIYLMQKRRIAVQEVTKEIREEERKKKEEFTRNERLWLCFKSISQLSKRKGRVYIYSQVEGKRVKEKGKLRSIYAFKRGNICI